jgi:hypothetical protein
MADQLTAPIAELFPIERELFHSEYQKFFLAKRQNFFVTLTAFRDPWEALQLLNDVLMREHSNLEHLTDHTQVLPKTIFSAAHARFLTAIELGFSCCIGDAYSILRDGIESVAHAHRLFKDPAAAAAWSAKHQGEAELRAHDKIFKWDKKKNLFPDDVPALNHLYTYYAHFCELATHTSVSSIGKDFIDLSTEGTLRWGLAYFETNPQRLAGFLNALLQVSAHMEEVFYGCFEGRLKLDPELGRMRSDFLKVRQQQSQRLMAIYNQAPTI